MSEFATRLRAALKLRHMSQRDLEIKSGIPHSSIQRYALPTYGRIPLDRVEKIAEALNVDPGYLMGWLDDPVPTNPRPEEMNELFRRLSIQEQDLIIAQVKGILASRED